MTYEEAIESRPAHLRAIMARKVYCQLHRAHQWARHCGNRLEAARVAGRIMRFAEYMDRTGLSYAP